MSPNNILPIIMCAILGLLIGYELYRSFSNRGTYTTVVNEGAVDEERTMCANAILHVVKYWLQELVSNEPIMSTSPDGQRNYFDVSTVEGHVLVQFDWVRNRIYLKYARHSLESGEAHSRHLSLRIKHGSTDEEALAKFLQGVAAYEQEELNRKIFNSPVFQDLVSKLLAQTQGSDEEDTENGGEQPPFLV